MERETGSICREVAMVGQVDQKRESFAKKRKEKCSSGKKRHPPEAHTQ